MTMGVLKGLLIKFYRLFLIPILALFSRRKTKKLPPTKNDLLKLSASDLADKIRKKEVTSEEVIRLFIERIREVNPIINAVLDERFDDALQEARKADKMVQGMSLMYLAKNYPFLGVPFTVKEAIGLKDLQFTVGVKSRINNRASKDGETVRLMRSAGAIPICITNNSELCMSLNCQNSTNGKSLNPYDLTRSSGGSNGGEGALIASGGSVMGLGSDLAGSLRITALFNGIYGHKPSAKLVHSDGVLLNPGDKQYERFLTIGPMTRYAKDLKPMLAVLSDKNPKLKLDAPISIKNVKIHYKNKINGVGVWFGAIGVDKNLNTSLTKAVQYFKDNGSTVAEAKIDLSNIYALESSIQEIEDYLSEKYKDKTPGRFNVVGRLRLRRIRNRATEFEDIKKKFIELLGEDGVLLFPSFCRPAIRPSEARTVWSGMAYCQFFNLLGFPATHVPVGLNKAGLPLGFQVIAAPFQDRLCLAVACELEQAFGGWVPPY